MEALKNYFKDKKIGFYLMLADALLGLVFSILFFTTYKTSMANNAVPHTPEVIGNIIERMLYHLHFLYF